MTRGWLLCLCVLLPLSGLAEELPASGTVEVLFSPWNDAEGTLLREIGAARRSIHVQAYVLTSRNIARALIEAHDRGVTLRVLADREMVEKNENSQVPKLHDAGIDVRLETRYAAAHNKIMLIDTAGERPVVVTGSYNYSFSAQARNAENLLILRGDAALARAYLKNWQRHRDEALPYAEAMAK